MFPKIPNADMVLLLAKGRFRTGPEALDDVVDHITAVRNSGVLSDKPPVSRREVYERLDRETQGGTILPSNHFQSFLWDIYMNQISALRFIITEGTAYCETVSAHISQDLYLDGILSSQRDAACKGILHLMFDVHTFSYTDDPVNPLLGTQLFIVQGPFPKAPIWIRDNSFIGLRKSNEADQSVVDAAVHVPGSVLQILFDETKKAAYEFPFYDTKQGITSRLQTLARSAKTNRVSTYISWIPSSPFNGQHLNTEEYNNTHAIS